MIKGGDWAFGCQHPAARSHSAATRVRSFEQMLDTEGPERVNPDSPCEQQLANIRRIYGPEKEALGVQRGPASADSLGVVSSLP